jgi:hypothetical protein
MKRYDNSAYGAAIQLHMRNHRLRFGDVAAAFGVSEIEVSAVVRDAAPSQKFTEAAVAQLGISYASFEILPEPVNDVHEAIDVVARDNVLPFPYRYRVQDDV